MARGTSAGLQDANGPLIYCDTKQPLTFGQNRRLTKLMRRELVRSLRTVALLAMFSQDDTTVGNIQSCLKSMTTMEPDLILDSILERAVPSLEALVEVGRTIKHCYPYSTNRCGIDTQNSSDDPGSGSHRTCYCKSERVLLRCQASTAHLESSVTGYRLGGWTEFFEFTLRREKLIVSSVCDRTILRRR